MVDDRDGIVHLRPNQVPDDPDAIGNPRPNILRRGGFAFTTLVAIPLQQVNVVFAEGSFRVKLGDL